MKYRDISSLKVSTVLVLLKTVICKGEKKKIYMERGRHQSERILTVATVYSQDEVTKQQVNANMDLPTCSTSLSNNLESREIQRRCSNHHRHLSVLVFTPCHTVFS